MDGIGCKDNKKIDYSCCFCSFFHHRAKMKENANSTSKVQAWIFIPSKESYLAIGGTAEPMWMQASGFSKKREKWLFPQRKQPLILVIILFLFLYFFLYSYSTLPFLFSRFHRYTSRCSSPWLEQSVADHLQNIERLP